MPAGDRPTGTRRGRGSRPPVRSAGAVAGRSVGRLNVDTSRPGELRPVGRRDLRPVRREQGRRSRRPSAEPVRPAGDDVHIQSCHRNAQLCPARQTGPATKPPAPTTTAAVPSGDLPHGDPAAPLEERHGKGRSFPGARTNLWPAAGNGPTRPSRRPAGPPPACCERNGFSVRLPGPDPFGVTANSG